MRWQFLDDVAADRGADTEHVERVGDVIGTPALVAATRRVRHEAIELVNRVPEG